MSSIAPLTEEHRIVVGKPLPFAIFTAERKLLLAAGHVVESERVRDMLVRNGRYRGTDASGDTAGAAEAAAPDRKARDRAERDEESNAEENVLELLRKDYDASGGGHRLSISIARSETEKAYAVQLLGVHAQSIIVTAPVQPDGSLVPVLSGQTWLCRTFQMTSAYRFPTLALNVAFEPFPHLHLKLQKEVEHRKVRGAPRAKVSLRGELHTPAVVPCMVADLSTSGARVAVDARGTLKAGQGVRLMMTLEVLQSKFDLALDATAVNAFGPSDARHPQVAFFGLKFSARSETESLVLHGFVSAHLLSEFHSLWQMLSMASTPNEAVV